MSGRAGKRGSVTLTVVTGDVDVRILGLIQLLDSGEQAFHTCLFVRCCVAISSKFRLSLLEGGGEPPRLRELRS